MIPAYSLLPDRVVEVSIDERDGTEVTRVTELLVGRRAGPERFDPRAASPPPDSTVPRHLARTGIG